MNQFIKLNIADWVNNKLIDFLKTLTGQILGTPTNVCKSLI